MVSGARNHQICGRYRFRPKSLQPGLRERPKVQSPKRGRGGAPQREYGHVFQRTFGAPRHPILLLRILARWSNVLRDAGDTEGTAAGRAEP